MSTPKEPLGPTPAQDPLEPVEPQSAADDEIGTTATGQPARTPGFGETYLREVLSSSWLLTLLAIVLAVLLGGVLIIATDPAVQEAAGYLFARPSSFFTAAWEAASQAYLALFQGAIYDSQAATFTRAIRPITETLTIATPLILAGLSVGLAFRAGLFNIGGQGQVILGAVLATWIGFGLDLPPVVHLVLALIGGAVGGAFWAAIAGVLKARTGAHEVIVTIMLNNVAAYLVLWVVTTQIFAGGTSGTSKPVGENARLPALLPEPFRLHLGFVLALVLAAVVWWLMERSTLGFKLRAVGSNARAARTAGISVGAMTVLAMAIAGGLAGLAGASQVLGTEGYLTASVAGTIGFDAITVALLGRSKPLGTVLAGLLFGALAAGGRLMQTRTGTPLDLVLVLQSFIVLFIAAPPLVRTIWRLPKPGARREKPSPTSTTPVTAGADA
ncbi:ABC transporter permease [Serinibacter arcticus]|uniref:Nucleoside ABC transporter, permease protein 1 n=1 Tax=Serinibacter arcticus TaxID=1655435 RepID=A0A4Z1E9L8_9MICO|nr:ABC transporter permease [Serinibacter arcticus]TGO06207.1 Nucleoside ABC transporter, permease protein 1 [Serinibacter arcticus]